MVSLLVSSKAFVLVLYCIFTCSIVVTLQIEILWLFLLTQCHFCIQEDSEKTGKVTSAGMYFLHFQVYRMDATLNAV